MKPMKVEAGEHAPDVEALLKQANELMEKAEKFAMILVIMEG